jgi:hypothetical protein
MSATDHLSPQFKGVPVSPEALDKIKHIGTGVPNAPQQRIEDFNASYDRQYPRPAGGTSAGLHNGARPRLSGKQHKALAGMLSGMG